MSVFWKYRFNLTKKLLTETQLMARHLCSVLMENGWENVFVGKCQLTQVKMLAFFGKASLLPASAQMCMLSEKKWDGREEEKKKAHFPQAQLFHLCSRVKCDLHALVEAFRPLRLTDIDSNERRLLPHRLLPLWAFPSECRSGDTHSGTCRY